MLDKGLNNVIEKSQLFMFKIVERVSFQKIVWKKLVLKSRNCNE